MGYWRRFLLSLLLSSFLNGAALFLLKFPFSQGSYKRQEVIYLSFRSAERAPLRRNLAAEGKGEESANQREKAVKGEKSPEPKPKSQPKKVKRKKSPKRKERKRSKPLNFSKTKKELKQRRPKPPKKELENRKPTPPEAAERPKEEGKKSGEVQPKTGPVPLSEKKNGAGSAVSSGKGAEKEKIKQKVKEGEEAAVRSYLALVLKEIERHKYYPPVARAMGVEGVEEVRLTFAPSGKLLKVEFLRSSSSLLKKGVIKTLKSCRFPPTPNGKTLTLKVKVVYRLK